MNLLFLLLFFFYTTIICNFALKKIYIFELLNLHRNFLLKSCNFLQYESIIDMNSNFHKYLKNLNLALFDLESNKISPFKYYIIIFSIKNINILNKLNKENKLNIIFLELFYDFDECIIAQKIHLF